MLNGLYAVPARGHPHVHNRYGIGSTHTVRGPNQFPTFLTLNPLREPEPRAVFREIQFEHPVYDAAALAAQRSLADLQGRDRIWFCGSYFGYGFHEDALTSGLDVGERLGVAAPWRKARLDRSEVAPGRDREALVAA